MLPSPDSLMTIGAPRTRRLPSQLAGLKASFEIITHLLRGVGRQDDVTSTRIDEVEIDTIGLGCHFEMAATCHRIAHAFLPSMRPSRGMSSPEKRAPSDLNSCRKE